MSLMITQNCEGCPYKGFPCKKHAKPPHEVDVVFVSERPFLEDLNTGKLFSDPSGNILRKVLNNNGFPRDKKIYATSVIKCVPQRGESVKPEAIRACHATLISELSEANPKVIFAMGNTALRAVMSDDSLQVTKVMGKILKWGFNTVVIPCIAPAAVERRPEEYDNFELAVERLIAYVNGSKSVDAGETMWRRFRRAEVPRLVEVLRKYPVLSLDVETWGFNPFNRKVINLGIAWQKNKAAIIDAEDFDLLHPLFDDPNVKQLWHNGKFDVKFLQIQHGLNARVDHDTMLLHYILNETKGTHDLEQLAVNYLGAAPYEEAVKRFLDPTWGYRYAPRSVLDPYLAKDVDYSLQLFNVFYGRVCGDKAFKSLYENFLIAGSNLLCVVEKNGVWLNEESRAEAEIEYTAQLAAAKEEMDEVVLKFWDVDLYMKQSGSKSRPIEFNPGSPKQLYWLIYDRLKLRSLKRMPQNTSEKTLLSMPEHPFIIALLKYRKVAKLLSTYIIGFKTEADQYDDHRIRSTYKLHGTVTGRLASAEPNMQNIPRRGKAREMFQAPNGRAFLEVDYAAAELRMLAVVSNDQALLDIFIEGRDLHSEVALEMYGPDFTEEQRVRAKAVNFGIAYGRTAHTLAQEFNITVIEAERMRQAWFGRFPDAARFLEARRADVEEGRPIRAITGQMRRYKVVKPELLSAMQNEACNFPMQGPASHMTLRSAYEMQPELTDQDVHIINLVHDSILFEMPDDKVLAGRLMARIAFIMGDVPRRFLKTEVPFTVDFKYGYRWGALDKIKD